MTRRALLPSPPGPLRSQGRHHPRRPLMPAAPVDCPPAATTNRLKLVLRAGGGLALEAGDVDATYGRRAFHIRRTPHAHEAIEVEFRANGNVAVASGHHTLGHCLDNWHGRNTVGNRQHFSTWYRTHGGHLLQLKHEILGRRR